jgi:hypothetical protein
MTKPIISVENLGKRYRVKRPGMREGGGLRHAIEAGAASLWNGGPPPIEHTASFSLVLHPSKAACVILAIQSTDHGNALPPSPPHVDGTDGLWNYEANGRLLSCTASCV